jgi:hypothetical protein
MNFLKAKLTVLILVVVLIGLLGGCNYVVDDDKPLVITQINYWNNNNKASYFVSDGSDRQIVFTDIRNKYNVGDTLIFVRR